MTDRFEYQIEDERIPIKKKVYIRNSAAADESEAKSNSSHLNICYVFLSPPLLPPIFSPLKKKKKTNILLYIHQLPYNFKNFKFKEIFVFIFAKIHCN